ncbi:MAG: spore cortex biosynthesis protein YabQ [Clostridia bacterium]|nr:spore cortex biosynthesis protein YabQ [Clostridia bacterium]
MFTDSIAQQLYSAFLFGGWGLLWGIYADLFAVWRQLFHSRKWVIFLQDIWLMVSGAVVFFLLSLPLSGGRMRWYLFVGTAVGWLAWRQTGGRYFVPLVCRFWRWIARCWQPIHRFGQKVYDKATVPFKKLGIFLKKFLHSINASLYNKLDYCARYAQKGKRHRKEGDEHGRQQLPAAAEEEKKHIPAHRPDRVRAVRGRRTGAVGNGDPR